MPHTCDHKHDRTHKKKSCGCYDHNDGCAHAHCDCGHDHHKAATCGCGHDHHEVSSCGCGCGHDHHEPQKGEGVVLLLGAALFAVGLLPLGIFSTIAHVAAYLLLGLPVLIAAGKNILKGHVFDENFLMAIATVGAFMLGEYTEAVFVIAVL